MKKVLLPLASVLCLFVSCVETNKNSEVDGEISFKTKIEESVTSTELRAGDKINVSAFDAGVVFEENVPYVYTQECFIAQETPITKKSKDQDLSFFATLPQLTLSGEDFEFSVKADQSTEEAYAESNLLTARVVETTLDRPLLVFNRSLVEAVVDCGRDISDAKITINAKMDAEGGVQTAPVGVGSVAAITPLKANKNTFMVVFPEQTISAGEVFASIELDGEVYEWCPETNMTLLGSDMFSFSWNLKDNSITHNGVIDGWEDGQTSEPDEPDVKPDATEPSFSALGASNVDYMAATLNATYAYTGSGKVDRVAFFYGLSGSSSMTSVNTTNAVGKKSINVVNLKSETAYAFYLLVSVDGKEYKSNTVTFTTDEAPEGPVVSGNTKYAYMPELPDENPEEAGNYYYAYHQRPDAQSIRNYAVCYSRDFMCPVWVAAPMHNSYVGGSGRNDSYRDDPDIPFHQTEKRSGYTRGHMLGSGERTVSVATNKTTFYCSNIAPQLSSGFNTGGGVWNNLEELVDDQVCSDTLYQVIGCYWANTNKKASGTTIPTHYYKVLLRTKRGNTGRNIQTCAAADLKCAAFMVAHNSSQHGTKPNRNMMISVAELEKKTGLTFFSNVPNAPKDSYNASDWGL